MFYWKLFCNGRKEDISAIKKMSQSLFYWKLFCNHLKGGEKVVHYEVTILVLLEAVLQYLKGGDKVDYRFVTILVLLEAVLQCVWTDFTCISHLGHNPCFTGSCSAIRSWIYVGCLKAWSQSLFYWKLFCNPRMYLD